MIFQSCWYWYNALLKRLPVKKRLIFPGKTPAKKKSKKKVLSKLGKTPKAELSGKSSPSENQGLPDDVEGERVVRKSTRTSVIVRQAEREIRAALQASMKVVLSYILVSIRYILSALKVVHSSGYLLYGFLFICAIVLFVFSCFCGIFKVPEFILKNKKSLRKQLTFYLWKYNLQSPIIYFRQKIFSFAPKDLNTSMILGLSSFSASGSSKGLSVI